jgi:hypothetical protein
MKDKVETPLADDLRPEYDETVLKDGVRGKYVRAIAAVPIWFCSRRM